MWGTIYADGASIVSADGLAKMMTSHCDRLRSSRPHGFGKKTEIMLLQTQDLASRASPLVIEAVDQRYKQTLQCLYLGGVMHEDADLMVEIKRRVLSMRACATSRSAQSYTT